MRRLIALTCLYILNVTPAAGSFGTQTGNGIPINQEVLRCPRTMTQHDLKLEYIFFTKAQKGYE